MTTLDPVTTISPDLGPDEQGELDELDQVARQRLPVWRLRARWKASGRRWLPGVWFPIALYAVWRVVELAVSLFLGGDPQYNGFFYDAQHYIRIMHIGYVHPQWIMPSNAFFPGISWLGWPIWKLTGSDLITVHTVATITGLAAFIAVWGVSKSLRGERIARRSVLLFALFPASMFLWAFYSEGLFIALGAGAVWADRRGKRGLATVLLIGIGATRSVGVLIPAVMVLARIVRQRRIDKWCWAYACAGVSSLVAVLIVMQVQAGNAFAFMSVQKDWGRSLSMPWTTVIQGYENLWPRPGTVMIPSLVARNFDLWCVPIVLLGVGYAAFSKRDRFPMEALDARGGDDRPAPVLERPGQLQPLRLRGLDPLPGVRLGHRPPAPTVADRLDAGHRGRTLR